MIRCWHSLSGPPALEDIEATFPFLSGFGHYACVLAQHGGAVALLRCPTDDRAFSLCPHSIRSLHQLGEVHRIQRAGASNARGCCRLRPLLEDRILALDVRCRASIARFLEQRDDLSLLMGFGEALTDDLPLQVVAVVVPQLRFVYRQSRDLRRMVLRDDGLVADK